MICFTGGFQENSNENDKNGKRQILIKKKKKINAKRRMKIEKIKLKKIKSQNIQKNIYPSLCLRKLIPSTLRTKNGVELENEKTVMN